MTVSGPITNGKDFNFFDIIAVSNTSFSSDASVVINIKRQRGLMLTNYGTDIVTYSFNGTTEHGDMRFNTPSAHLVFENRPITKIWFKVASGSANVRVEAWAGA